MIFVSQHRVNLKNCLPLQDHFRQGPSASKMKKREKSRRYWEKKREREKEHGDNHDDETRSSVCKFYKDGKCSRVRISPWNFHCIFRGSKTRENNDLYAFLVVFQGDDCQYSHDAHPEKKAEICKFYLNSHCSKGDRCIFMHGKLDVELLEKLECLEALCRALLHPQQQVHLHLFAILIYHSPITNEFLVSYLS